MTGINHMLTGGIIGAALASPVVIPIALASHFLLDMLPHYGIGEDTARTDDVVWKIDVVLITGFLTYMLFAQSDMRTWALVGALVAASPDFAWVYRFVVSEKFGKHEPSEVKSRFNHFHASIQKRESEDRLWIEALSLVALSGIFVRIIA